MSHRRLDTVCPEVGIIADGTTFSTINQAAEMLMLRGEIGGWVIGRSGSIGMYGRVSGKEKGFPTILSASIGIGWR